MGITAAIPAFFPSSGFAQWTVETVHQGDTTNGESRLKYDALGRPVIALGGGRLLLASWDGAGWSIDEIDASDSLFSNPQLAIEPTGSPMVAYIPGYPPAGARIARPAGASWDSAWTAPSFTCFSLDSTATPVMSRSNGNLEYARWNGASWDLQVVDTVDASVQSLALDGADRPAIAYLDPLSFELKYAHWNGASWDIQVVESAVDASCVSLALDSAGNPVISYYSSAVSTRGLKLARFDGLAWTIQHVEAANVGERISVALDGSGNESIAYSDNADYTLKMARWNGSTWDIQKFAQSGTAWNIQSVAYTDDDRYCAQPAPVLGMDASGNPMIAYYDASLEALRLARYREAVPIWSRTYGLRDLPEFAGEVPGAGFLVAGHGPPLDVPGMIYRVDYAGDVVFWKALSDPTAVIRAGALDAAGGAFVAASIPSPLGENAGLLRVDQTGSILWQKQFEYTDESYPLSIDTADDGGAIVLLENMAPADFIWVLKIDAQGSLQWSKEFGVATGQSYPTVVRAMPAGGYAVAGYTTSSYRGWCYRLDSTGSVVWQKALWDGAAISDIQPTPDSGLAALSNPSAEDPRVLKLDAAGDIEWAKSYSPFMVLQKIRAIPGGFAVMGVEDSGQHPVFLKLDASGGLVSARLLPDVDSGVYGFRETADGGFILFGERGAGMAWLLRTDGDFKTDPLCDSGEDYPASAQDYAFSESDVSAPPADDLPLVTDATLSLDDAAPVPQQLCPVAAIEARLRLAAIAGATPAVDPPNAGSPAENSCLVFFQHDAAARIAVVPGAAPASDVRVEAY